MIKQMVILARTNRIDSKVQNEMQHKKFNTFELLELNEMNNKELKYLMMFCDIRLYEGVPVVALEDDEMRMAYLCWRAAGQSERMEKRANVRHKIWKVRNIVTHHIERELLT